MTVGAITPMGYNDPYFMQAYNSPNSNYQLMQQQQAQMAQQQAATQAATQNSAQSAISESPAFKGSAAAIQSEAKEEKGSSAGKWILGIASVAALAWGGYKCFKKGNGEGFASENVGCC